MDQYWYESMKDVGAIVDKDGNPVVTYKELWDYLDKEAKKPRKVNEEGMQRLIEVYTKVKEMTREIEGSSINNFVYDPQYYKAKVTLFLSKKTTFSGPLLEKLKYILKLTKGCCFCLNNSEDKIRLDLWTGIVWEDA